MEREDGLYTVSEARRQALNIPHILENIMSYMDWKTISACRQISKKWYKLSLNSWRDLAPPIQFGEFQVYRGKNAVLNLLPTSLFPEEKYRWGGVNEYKHMKIVFTQLHNADWMNMFNFISRRRLFVTKLHMDSCTFHNLDVLKDIVYCKHTPNLTSLKLTGMRFEFRDDHYNIEPTEEEPVKVVEAAKKDAKVGVDFNGYEEVRSLTSLDMEYFSVESTRWPIPWMDLLPIYPILKEIRLAKYLTEDMENFFIALMELDKVKKLTSLTSIDVGDQRPTEAFKCPLTLYKSMESTDGFLPNLTSISITLFYLQKQNGLENLLICASSKLVHLKVTGWLTKKRRSINFPVDMPKLESIALIWFQLKNLNFLAKTPKLKKLYIFEGLVHSQNIVQSSVLPDDFRLVSMNTFACNQAVAYGIADISTLQMWMPKLSTLKLHLNNSSFNAVCNKFPKLRRLHICHSKVTDYAGTSADQALSENLNETKRKEPDEHTASNNDNNEVDGHSNCDSLASRWECQKRKLEYGNIYLRFVFPQASYDTNSSACLSKSTSGLQDLKVLVIDKCEEEAEVALSTIPSWETFPLLPKLQELFVEQGVTTVFVQRYSSDCGQYRDYYKGNWYRPLFID